jgi:hypothetical protein
MTYRGHLVLLGKLRVVDSIRWMYNSEGICSVFVGESLGLQREWEDNVNMDLKKPGCELRR